jgi:hypothetical protein
MEGREGRGNKENVHRFNVAFLFNPNFGSLFRRRRGGDERGIYVRGKSVPVRRGRGLRGGVEGGEVENNLGVENGHFVGKLCDTIFKLFLGRLKERRIYLKGDGGSDHQDYRDDKGEERRRERTGGRRTSGRGARREEERSDELKDASDVEERRDELDVSHRRYLVALLQPHLFFLFWL